LTGPSSAPTAPLSWPLPVAPDPVMACHGQQLRGTRSQLYALLMQALG
jgi:hypothetical protein